MPSLKERLLTLLQGEGTTEQQLRQEIDNLRTDTLLDDLRAAGHLTADAELSDTARKFAQADPDGFAKLMRAGKPTPAQTTTFVPPTAPRDETEEAIQAHMAKNSVPYHEAAAAVVTNLQIPDA